MSRSRRPVDVDDLVLQLRESFGMTLVVVSHELASIFGIADLGIVGDVHKVVPALKKGGKVKTYAKGGSVKGSGCEQRGLRKCKVY